MSLSERVVIFCNTVQSCNDVSAGLDEYGIVHVAFHGSMAPAQSFANYRSFIDKVCHGAHTVYAMHRAEMDLLEQFRLWPTPLEWASPTELMPQTEGQHDLRDNIDQVSFRFMHLLKLQWPLRDRALELVISSSCRDGPS